MRISKVGIKQGRDGKRLLVGTYLVIGRNIFSKIKKILGEKGRGRGFEDVVRYVLDVLDDKRINKNPLLTRLPLPQTDHSTDHVWLGSRLYYLSHLIPHPIPATSRSTGERLNRIP